MASTFANAGCLWRIRTDGNELNGGGFDPFVTNAGTDYTDQAFPQLSLTDLATAGVSASVSSVTGGFTSAMIGNVLRIASGTNFTADYYVVTAVTDSNNATLDRACTIGAGSGGVCRLGGAHASLMSYANAAFGSLTTPTLGTPIVPGNRIYIRGDGSLDPSTATYDWSTGYWQFPVGTRSAAGGGPIIVIGYNGRPRIDHCGRLFGSEGWDTKHLSFFRKLNTNAVPVRYDNGSFYSWAAVDCIFDQNGYDSTEYAGAYGGVFFCEFRNTGGGAAGTAEVCSLSHPSSGVIGNWFHDLRGPAMAFRYGSTTRTTFCTVCYNTIANNLSDGIVVDNDGTVYHYAIFNNTIDNNGGHGINFLTKVFSFVSVFNNIISNHTGASKYAFNFADSYQQNKRQQKSVVDFNCFYGNTTNFNSVSGSPAWQLQTHDITVDPQYVNAASGNYVTGANVRNMGLSGLGGLDGTLGTSVNKINIGAYQSQPSSSGATGVSLTAGLSFPTGLSLANIRGVTGYF